MESVDTAFLPLPEDIVLELVHPTATAVVVQIACRQKSAACPRCERPSERVHGHYTRTVADLPCGGRRVLLHFVVRKFVCPTLECPQQIFTERRPEFVQSYARMTNRLREALLALGMTTGGESGERLAPKLGMSISAPTLLRHMRSIALLPPEPIRLLGIDDFAFRRGTTYGTILIDLERQRPIDLLPDRSAATAEAWLCTHPEIDCVSRDRGGEYAAAASRGAPQAQQIADKFHLVKNLIEALDPLFERNKACLRFMDTPEAAAEADPGSAPPPAPHEMRPAPSKQAEQTRLAHRQERLQRYEQVRALRDQGFTTPAIVARVGLSRSTVNRFLAAPAFPERQRRCKEATKLDPYRAYLSEHWQEGAQGAVHLFRAITALGYTGSSASVYA